MGNDINRQLTDALDATKKILQFLNSDLTFDSKIDYVEQMLDKRETIFKSIEGQKIEKNDDCLGVIKSIVDYDEPIRLAIKTIQASHLEDIEDLLEKKIAINKTNQATKKYLNPQSQVGYFINHTK